MDKTEKNVWYLEGPFFRYAGDVKKLARRAGVRIIDSRYAEPGRPNAAPEKDLPKVELKAEYRTPTAEELEAIEKARQLTAGGK